MNTTTAYTPLESLLLFQCLTAYGTGPDAFIRISDALKKNVVIKTSDTYDPGRLSPDALQEVYLRLIRENLRIEAVENDSNGEASPSKKRKLQTSVVATIKDATEYRDKLPHFVDRLFGRYRDHMLRSIRQDEQKYETLIREVAEIERGEWDGRTSKDEISRGNRSASVESRSKKGASKSPMVAPVPIPTGGKEEAPTPATATNEGSPLTEPNSPLLPSASEIRPGSSATDNILTPQDASPTAAIPSKVKEASIVSDQVQNNLRKGLQGVQPLPRSDQKTTSNDGPHGPSPLQPAQQNSALLTQKATTQPVQRPPENWKWEQYQGGPPQTPLQYPPNPNHPQLSNSQYPPPYSPYAPPRGSFSGPTGQQPPLPPPARVPSSPLNASQPTSNTLPSQNIVRDPGSLAAPHLDQLANAAEQHRAPSGSHMTQPGPMQGPIPSTLTGLPPSSPYGQPYSGYPPPPAQWNSQYPPQQYVPPPANYGYSPQLPHGQRPFAPGPEILQAAPRQYNSPYNASHGSRPIQPSASSSTPRLRNGRDSAILPHTPSSLSRALNQTGRATIWTSQPSPSTPKAPLSPKPPTYEPLSPVLAPLKPTSKGSSKKNESSPVKRGGRAGRGGRVGTVASSALGHPPGSQTQSHPDDFSLDNGGDIRKFKQESSTPRPMEETGDTTAEEGPSNQRRVHVANTSSPRKVHKRKRPQSVEPRHRHSGPATQVSWTRNFPKISASALERIGAHRYANTFALPLKEKDAPGYRNVILRPQDLKSIRSSLIAGSKAGAAIVAGMENQDQSALNVTLPISADLVPPKGIVNNAQLEKELNHMFANAIMFNPDPNRGFGKAFQVAQSVEGEEAQANYDFDEDGVVKDTRAMFADVETIMRDLRSAEDRGTNGSQNGNGSGNTGSGDRVVASEAEPEEDETDDASAALTGDPDHGGSVAKRRRRI